MGTKKITQVYNEKGLNGLYAFLRKNNVKFEKNFFDFGLQANKEAIKKKSQFVNHEKLQFHYCNQLIRSRKNGFSYNLLRGVKIVLL